MSEEGTPCPHCGDHGHELLLWSLWGGWFTRFTGWRHCPWCDKTHHPEPGSFGAMSWLIMPVLGLPIAIFAISTFFCCVAGAVG